MTAPRPLLIAAALLALAPGCKRSEAPRQGVRIDCTCTYLTDFDDTARVDVEVCVPEGRDLKGEAKHCALQSAHNHIDDCACKPPSGPCDPSSPQACVNR